MDKSSTEAGSAREQKIGVAAEAADEFASIEGFPFSSKRMCHRLERSPAVISPCRDVLCMCSTVAVNTLPRCAALVQTDKNDLQTREKHLPNSETRGTQPTWPLRAAPTNSHAIAVMVRVSKPSEAANTRRARTWGTDPEEIIRHAQTQSATTRTWMAHTQRV